MVTSTGVPLASSRAQASAPLVDALAGEEIDAGLDQVERACAAVDRGARVERRRAVGDADDQGTARQIQHATSLAGSLRAPPARRGRVRGGRPRSRRRRAAAPRAPPAAPRDPPAARAGRATAA